MYRTPLGSSSARSEALPPIGTTFPNVPAMAELPRLTPRAIIHPKNLFRISDLTQVTNHGSLYGADSEIPFSTRLCCLVGLVFDLGSGALSNGRALNPRVHDHQLSRWGFFYGEAR